MAQSDTINEYIFKFKGDFRIPEPIKTGTSYRVGVDVDITEARKKLNHNGTYDLVLIGEIEKGEILKDTGEIIKSIDKSSQSQKMRKQIFAMGEDYDEIMNLLRVNMEEIIQTYKYKLDK